MILFAGSVIGHWTAGWYAYVDEQQMHGEAAQFADYSKEAFRDMLENWQAEFMGIAWQIVGLAALYAVGSPQSKEGASARKRSSI